MQSTFTYRVLTPEDAKAWRDLRIEGTRDFPLGFLITLDEAKAADIDRCGAILRSGALRGVFLGTYMVGFCGIRLSPLARIRHRAELGPFFVRTDHQGGGAADALMSGVISEARRLRLARLELYVDTENLRAIAFYRRHGFDLVATHPDSVRINGQSRDDHFLCLRLTD